MLLPEPTTEVHRYHVLVGQTEATPPALEWRVELAALETHERIKMKWFPQIKINQSAIVSQGRKNNICSPISLLCAPISVVGRILRWPSRCMLTFSQLFNQTLI